jgi:O-antigen ligase
MFSCFAFMRKKGMAFLLAVFAGSIVSIFLLRWVWGVDVVAYVGNRIADLSDIHSGEIRDDSARNRIGLFWYLWNTFLENPIVGWGPGGAGRIAEGQWIRELVEGGIIGGTLFLYLMVRNGWIAVRSYRLSDDPMVQGISIGFACGLAGLFGQSLFTELFILTKIGVPFWMLAAVVHRLYMLEQKRLALP